MHTIQTPQSTHKQIQQATTELPTEAGLEGSQARIACDPLVASLPTKVHRGLDFLKVSFWIDFSSSRLFEILEFMKRQLQDSEFDQAACFAEYGLKWNLHRTGTKMFKFRLSMGDVTLMLNKRKADGVIPTARLEIGSLSSQTNFYSIYEDVLKWLEYYEGTVVTEKVSEVHLAADFIGVDIRTLGIQDEDKWIHRSTNFLQRNYYRKLNSVTIGHGNFMLRIYDKVLELKRSDHKQEVFAELWSQNKFDQAPVTRVEYQIRRPVMREFATKKDGFRIVTVKDLMLSLSGLWKYCTTDWSKFMSTVVDRKNKHQSRADYSEFWKIVRAVVWTGVHEINRQTPTKHKNIDALRKQARGIFMSIMAFFVEEPDNIDKIVSLSQDLLEEDLHQFFENESKFIKRMKVRRAEALITEGSAEEALLKAA
ncbi:hypothetical protein [Desulfogranum marinum]|uniref:hypothetical protein n=1 Tax=Desulfogranum marinum TaxID=453220 RepID=UPI0029C94509|nr:hypothetical protein [Desulfogranum marinum]